MRCLLLIFFILFNSPTIFSQDKGYYSIETGLSFSQLPDWSNHSSMPLPNHEYKSHGTDFPSLSPIVGVLLQFELSKYWFCNIGLQYQTTGRVTHSVHETNIISGFSNPYHFSEYTSRQIFHKAAIPIAIGYNLNFKKHKIGISAGFRYNRILRGHFSSTYHHIESAVTVQNIKIENNPFDSNQYVQSPKREMKQFFTNVSFQLNSKIEFSTRLNISQYDFYYREVGNPQCDVGCGEEMNGNDLQFMVRYYFKK